jgi:hypothetical protein
LRASDPNRRSEDAGGGQGFDKKRSRVKGARNQPRLGEPRVLVQIQTDGFQIHVVKPIGGSDGYMMMSPSGSGRSGGNWLSQLVKVKTILEATYSNVSIV